MKNIIQFILFLFLVCGIVGLGISNNTQRKEIKKNNAQMDSLNTTVLLKIDSIKFLKELINMPMNAYHIENIDDFETYIRKEIENEIGNDIKVIANFYKYRDEDSLFEGIGYDFSDIKYRDMKFSDNLLIFNFEEGTVKKVKRDSKKYVYDNFIKGFSKEKTITGDFNGDGKQDTLIVENYEFLLKQRKQGSIDELESVKFIFSDKTIPKFNEKIGYGENLCFDYMIKNEGDLNGDGGDEIGIIYDIHLVTMILQLYSVFTLKNDKWVRLITVEISKEMLSSGILPFEKDPEQNDFLIYEPIYKRFHTYPNFIYDRLYVVEKTIRIK